MEKREADYIIKQYIKPIYGFSINKTKNIEMAEELSNYILLEIYRILLKKMILLIFSTIFLKLHIMYGQSIVKIILSTRTIFVLIM